MFNWKTETKKEEKKNSYKSMASSGYVSRSKSEDDYQNSLLNPLNILSPLSPLNPINQMNMNESINHSHQDYTPPANDYTPPSHDYTPSNDSSSYDSGSNYSSGSDSTSYDSGSSSVDSSSW